jgi:hypothetical protein
MHLVVIGGSDAGISAALRARELRSDFDVSVIVADAFPKLQHLRPTVLRQRRDARQAPTPPFGSPLDAVQVAAQV